MEIVTIKKGETFKLHNTWDLINEWNVGGREKFNEKLLKTLKSFLKKNTDLGRVKKSYTHQGENVIWFCYETKQNTVKVTVCQGMNMNGGTWFKIHDVEIVDNLLATV